MSNDWISRRNLIKAIYAYVEQHRNDEEISWTGYDWLLKEDAVIDIINSQPTAYDVDKVAEQLEKQSKWVAYDNFDRDIGMTHKVVPFGKIREILKAGGVNG